VIPSAEKLAERGFLPFQADLIRSLSAQSKARMLVSLPAGVGKTSMISEVARIRVQQTIEARTLVVTSHPALLAQWYESLLEGFPEAVALTPQTIREIEADTARGANPWMSFRIGIVSLDSIKTPARITEVVAASWDLVVLDETPYSREESQRGRAARALWTSERAATVLALTNDPHAFLAIADTSMPSVVYTLDPLLVTESTPDRDIQEIDVPRSEPERELHQELARVLRNMKLQVGESPVLEAVSSRASSSLYSLEQALRRALLSKHARLEFGNDGSLQTDQDRTDPVWSETSVVELSGMLALLEDIPQDNKVLACHRLLQQHATGVSSVVFTEYAETADYLGTQLEALGWPNIVLTGKVPPGDRARAVAGAAEQSKTLVTTTTALKGLEFLAGVCIHYDLPRNPLVMEMRMSRVDRYGRQGSLKTFALRDETG